MELLISPYPEWVEIGYIKPKVINSRKITAASMNAMKGGIRWKLELCYSNKFYLTKDWMSDEQSHVLRFIYPNYKDCKNDYIMCRGMLQLNLSRHAKLYNLTIDDIQKITSQNY